MSNKTIPLSQIDLQKFTFPYLKHTFLLHKNQETTVKKRMKIFANNIKETIPIQNTLFIQPPSHRSKATEATESQRDFLGYQQHVGKKN